MSLPTNGVNGQVPIPPTAGPAPIKRKKPAAVALFKPTNNQKKRLPQAPPAKFVPKLAPPRPTQTPSVNVYANARTQAPPQTQSQAPSKDFRLIISKRDLVEGMRYHLLQLDDKISIDIRNESDFAKPAHLHRRDPKWNMNPRDQAEESKEASNSEAETINKRKEARLKEKEANKAQVAPSANPARQILVKKKTLQVYRNAFDDDEKQRIQMNYEEKLPWILEDFENKNSLVGKHQIGSRNLHAAIAYEVAPDGSGPRYRIMPVEKVYRFDKKRQVEDVDIEEAEKIMKGKTSWEFEPEVVKRKREEHERERQIEAEYRKSRNLFTVEKGISFNRAGEDADLDFEDDFADDEEGDLFVEKDEDEKLAEKKVKEEHLQANIGWDEKNYLEMEEAEKKEDAGERFRKVHAKDMRRRLEKRERNYNLGSSSDDDDSSDDSEEERRLEAEKQANLKTQDEANKSALSSGTNTPSGRKEKQPVDRLGVSDREATVTTKKSSSKSLKRPGSPNLSDASGTDTSTIRKKKRKSHHLSQQPTPSGSRALSPDMNQARSFGPGSDTDAGAMSDGTKAARVKVKQGSPSARNSPPVSRPGSPGPQSLVSRSLEVGPLPTPEEVRAKIPHDGLATAAFLKLYKTPTDPARKKQWLGMVRNRFFTKDGKIYYKDNMPASVAATASTPAGPEVKTESPA